MSAKSDQLSSSEVSWGRVFEKREGEITIVVSSQMSNVPSSSSNDNEIHSWRFRIIHINIIINV